MHWHIWTESTNSKTTATGSISNQTANQRCDQQGLVRLGGEASDDHKALVGGEAGATTTSTWRIPVEGFQCPQLPEEEEFGATNSPEGSCAASSSTVDQEGSYDSVPCLHEEVWAQGCHSPYQVLPGSSPQRGVREAFP